jgi:hypothetical protein
MHYPGEVTQSDGTTSLATWWVDYTLAPNTTYVIAKGAVRSDFWVSFFVILFQSFIPDALDFSTTWFWNCIDDSTCKVKTCGTMCGVCSRRVITSSWVNPYQMDGFMHRTSTWRPPRGSNCAHSAIVQIRIWLKNNMHGKTCWTKFSKLLTLSLLFLMHN